VAIARNAALSALALTTLTSPVHADRVSGTRSEQVYERRHDVQVTLARGWAELRVRRAVENLGKRHDQAMFWIDVPRGAAATGLRTLGTAAGHPRWFAGELMEAEAAAAKYRELTGIGGYYPKDPALLSWRSQDLLALQVFPVPPNDSKTVEYTLLLPTRYHGGAHRLELPGMGTSDRAAEVTLAAPAAGDSLRVDGRPRAAGTTLRTALGDSAELALIPRMNEPVGGELAAAQAASHRWVTHFSVEAAPRLSSAPKRAYVVLVLDASRSLAEDLVNAEKAAAAAYLSHLDDAMVEIVTFARSATRRYGRFVSAARARRDLSAMKIETHNGSAVETALVEAEKILAKAPAGRPRRIVLVSDGHVRTGLKPERVRAALGPSGAVVHLGVLAVGWPSLARNDAHPWAAAARATGGLVWNAQLSALANPRQAARVYEEWVRPVRIDGLRLYSPDIDLGTQLEQPASVLDEGEGIERSFINGRGVSWLRVEGELWSRPVERVLHADAKAGKRWSALTFGSALLDELSEPEMMTLALAGGAVSPVTSYLAIEPGVRPSTEGLDWGSGSGVGRGSGVPRVRMGATHASGRAPAVDRDAWLRNELSRSFKACGGKAGSATVSLETTFAEVVDVTKVDIDDAKDPLLSRCLSEAAWSLILPSAFDAEWDSWTLYL